MRRLAVALLLLSGLAFAQEVQVRSSSAFPQFANDPGSCRAGQTEYNTSSDAGKICNNAGTWVAVGSSTSFDQILPGTNTGALQVGAGGSLAPTGGGTITANVGAFLNGTLNAFPIFTGTTGANNLGTSLLTTDGTTVTMNYTGGLNIAGSGSGVETFSGATSGSAAIGVGAIAGTPNKLLFSTTNGSNGQFETSDGGNPQIKSWTRYFLTNAQTGTYQVVAADFQLCKTIPVASGTFTVTLVASGSQPADGQCIRILNYGNGTVTVARSGQNINGAAANLTIAAGSASAPNGLLIVSDAANYFAQPLGSGGSGTVTSVTFTGDGILDSSTPSTAVTTSGTVTATALTQAANKVLAGPTSGGAVAPTFRSLVGTDLPNPASTTLGGIESFAAVSHQFINTISTSGVPNAAQPAISDISNLDLVDAQTGTSYTIVAADCGKLATFNNASATAVTLPQATGSFVAPCSIGVENLGAGVVTITPTTSTIAGLTAIALNQNQGVIIFSDSTNYQVLNFTPSYLPVAAQVDTLQVGGTATGTDPFIQAIGSDTNIGIRLLTKGTGQITLQQGTDGSVLVIKNAGGTVVDTVTSSTGAIRLGAAGTPGAILDVASKYFVSSGGVNTKYNNISTVSNGHGAEYATVDLTAQSAAITATTLYAVPAAANGMYRVCFVAKVTTAATTSSTLGGAAGFQLTYTDQDDSVVVTTLSGAFWDSNATNIALNTTQAHMGGCTVVNAKASTNIQYIMGYTSSGGTAMQYNLHIKAEAL